MKKTQMETGGQLILAVVLALTAAPSVRAQAATPCVRIQLQPAACLLSVLAAADTGGALKPQITERDSFTVIGIETRTNNTEAATTIPRQWERFFREGLLARIPNKADGNILAVYSGYTSDHHGDYDYLIGARVKDGSRPPERPEGPEGPEAMVVKVVPKARYAVVTTAQGPVGKVVSAAWRKIWTLEDKDAAGFGGRRAYKADFEVYDQRSRDPDNSQVDIYVGIE